VLSGTQPGRRGPHEGAALVTRGRSPGYTRAQPWLHEGAALVTRGRSPGYTRAQPWPKRAVSAIIGGSLLGCVDGQKSVSDVTQAKACDYHRQQMVDVSELRSYHLKNEFSNLIFKKRAISTDDEYTGEC
jgi:hypothetical protein